MRKHGTRVLSVLRDGTEVDLSSGVVSWTVNVGLTALFGTFRLEVYIRHLRGTAAEADGKLRLRTYDEANGLERPFVGLVDKVETRSTVRGAFAAISGRSYAAVLAQSHVNTPRYTYTSSPSEVIAALCAPHGVKVITPHGGSASGTVEFGRLTVLEAVRHIALHQGLAMVVRPDGETVEFTKDAPRRPSGSADYILHQQDLRGALLMAELRPSETDLDEWQ